MNFIPLFFLSPLLVFSLYRYKKNNNFIPVIVVGLYAFSAVCTVFTDAESWYPFFSNSSYNPENFVIYSILLYPFLLCSFFIKPLDWKFSTRKSLLSNVFYLAIIILGLFSLIYQLPFAFTAMLIGAEKIREQQNNFGLFILPQNIFTTIAVAISYFYFFYIILFFVSLLQRRSFFIKFLLILCSLSHVVSGITFGTRDVFFSYTFSFLFCFFYFRNLLDIKLASRLKAVFLIISSISLFAVILISVDRFSDRNVDNSLAYGTLGYFGQQPFVFSVTVEEQKDFYNGNLRFSVFKSLLGMNVSTIERKHHYETSFGTFIKDLYSEGGWFFLISSTIIFITSLFVIYKFNRRSLISNRIVVDVYLFQFLSTGIFYYMLGTRAGNIYFLILGVIFILNLFVFYILGGRKLRL